MHLTKRHGILSFFFIFIKLPSNRKIGPWQITFRQNFIRRSKLTCMMSPIGSWKSPESLPAKSTWYTSGLVLGFWRRTCRVKFTAWLNICSLIYILIIITVFFFLFLFLLCRILRKLRWLTTRYTVGQQNRNIEKSTLNIIRWNFWL